MLIISLIPHLDALNAAAGGGSLRSHRSDNAVALRNSGSPQMLSPNCVATKATSWSDDSYGGEGAEEKEGSI